MTKKLDSFANKGSFHTQSILTTGVLQTKVELPLTLLTTIDFNDHGAALRPQYHHPVAQNHCGHRPNPAKRQGDEASHMGRRQQVTFSQAC